MDEVDRFHEVFREQGGRHSPTTPLDEQLFERASREVARQYKDPAMKPAPPRIEIGVVRNPAFNARATLVDGVGYIGIYWGSYALPFYLFNRMLARSDVLTDIGNPSAETANEADLFYPPKNILEFSDQMGHKNVIMPKDPARQKYVAVLVTILFDFLVLHEFAHLANGHVALLQARHAAKVIDESAIDLDPVLRQTLEMDADSFAVGQFMKFIASQQHAALKGASREELVFELMFAVYSALRLFGFWENSENATHPSPDTRRSLIGATIATWIVSRFGEIDGRLWSVASKALWASEEAFSRTFGGEIPRAEIAQTASARTRAWMDKILAGWKVVRPDLDRLAFRSGLAP